MKRKAKEFEAFVRAIVAVPKDEMLAAEAADREANPRIKRGPKPGTPPPKRRKKAVTVSSKPSK